MKFSLPSFFRKLFLFLVSIALGVAGYICVVFFLRGESVAAKVSTSVPDLRPATEVITFDGKLTKIAQVAAPVDLDYDAMGVTYVLDRSGKLTRVGLNADGKSETTVYARLMNDAVESSIGFSAIAFHPHFLMTDAEGFGCFYVVASEKADSGKVDFSPLFGNGAEHHQDVVYEFRTNNPFELNFSGEKREVVRFSQPGADNNLQSLAFDDKGLLYLAIGDGSSSIPGKESLSKNASSLTSAYGKILRIDPTGRDSANQKYGIPPRNPFKIAPHAIPELWAYGLRAPHSLSYDPFSKSICVTELGGDGTSEINLCTRAAEHFGWDLCEGSFLYPPSAGNKLTEGVTPPAVEFDATSQDSTRTGSFVYRGERFPTLVGKLVFASNDGRLMASGTGTDESEDSPVQILDYGSKIDKEIAALRPGPFGEIFVLCSDGEILEVHKTITAANHRKSRRPLVCAIFLK